MTVPNAPAGEGNTKPGQQPSILGEQTPAAGSGKPPEGQPPADGGKPPEGGQSPSPEGQPKPEGAPEKYEFKFPEGSQVDTGLVSSFEGVARELNLPQDKAQKLIDLYANHAAAVVETQEKMLADQRKEWREKIVAEKGHEERLGMAKRAVEHFAKADADLGSLLNGTWIGDHPSMVRFLSEVGKLLKEHAILDGKPAAGEKSPSTSGLLYPSMAAK